MVFAILMKFYLYSRIFRLLLPRRWFSLPIRSPIIGSHLPIPWIPTLQGHTKKCTGQDTAQIPQA
ncbi:hypothetical protein RSAG8_04915, partial [Rhizoctonia solani AG-8 WAC10335]